MSKEVDLQQLVIDRQERGAPRVWRGRHVLTRFVIPLALLAGFAGLAGWASWDVVFPPREVTVVPVLATRSEVQQGGTPLFQAAGWVEPRPTPIRVAALAPGVVDTLLVVEDERVDEGQPVARLVEEDARLALDRARADLRLREAEVEQARAAVKAAKTRLDEPVHLRAALGEAQAALAKVATELEKLPHELRQARARLDFAQRDFEGKKAAGGAVAGRDVDAAQSELEIAEARVEELSTRMRSLESEREALKSRRDALQRRLELLADELEDKEEAEAKLSAATARVEQAEVAVAEAELRMERMVVRAPTAGRVYQLVGHPGATLGGSGGSGGFDHSTVVTLYRPHMLQIRVDVRFEDIPKVELGQPVRIENPALDEAVSGRVLYISSEADIQKNTLDVKVELPSAPSVLKPEMLVDCTFLAPPREEEADDETVPMRMFIPRNTVQQGDDGPYVWLADQTAGVARRRSVTLGRVSGEMVEVVDGLTIASRVVADGAERLNDQDRIEVVGEVSPTVNEK